MVKFKIRQNVLSQIDDYFLKKYPHLRQAEEKIGNHIIRQFDNKIWVNLYNKIQEENEKN